MIKKISQLKNFGKFHDFYWREGLHDFKKFNLIYGWNRSGKTTLSRVFASCEKKSTYNEDTFKQYPENGEFEIETDDGTTLKNTDIATNVLPIKVFNQDFIDENISFDTSHSSNPIVYISKEDIETKNKLKSLKDQVVTLSNKLEQFKEKLKVNKDKKDTFRIHLAQIITRLLTNKTIQDKYFSYDKRKIKDKISEIGIDSFDKKILSDEEKTNYEETSKSEEKKDQTQFSNYQFSFSFDEETTDSFHKIFEKVEKLFRKQVVSETLKRLKDDPKLNYWVEQGFDLHKTKAEKDKCLFCEKPLNSDFLNKLSKHFNQDYENLQMAIANLKNEIPNIKKDYIKTKNDELYPDLKDTYENKAQELNECIKKTNAWIDEVVVKLKKKHDNLLANVSSPMKPEDFLTSYNSYIEELNKIIDKHNQKVNNHASEVTTAKEKLELHTIAIALKDQNYKKMVANLEDAFQKKIQAETAVNKNNSDIAELKRQTSNIGEAIPKINDHLKEFFGREEIKLELDENKEGYTIKRDGQPAKNLSESEKTAIALSYFVVKVGENNFNKSKGIIFIDDPISSFDSNFIYHCFSMIKTHFKEVGQLFISTHNFQLFNLVKKWFVGKNQKRTDNDKNKLCKFFMVESFTEADVRKAKIVQLDKTLQDYNSEYHFLFVKLREFSEKQDTQYKDFYTIGNIARRFFDIFVDFKIPSTGDQKSKMDMLLKKINAPNKKISEVEADKSYTLFNNFSHNSDPTSTIEHKNKSEVKNAIEILLKIVKESDSTHYDILENNFNTLKVNCSEISKSSTQQQANKLPF